MGLAFKNNDLNSFFRLVKNWDIESKKELIIKLTQSINESPQQSHDFSSCFGAWDDDRSAEEIINDIQNARINSEDIEEF